MQRTDPTDSSGTGLLVTCVMPTRDRLEFARQSIWYFLRQDHSARELIILDDGQQAITSIVPRDPRIRHVRLAQRTGLAAKRNLGCELAAGELIANWDDDDWIAPQRLSAQVRRLTETGSDICVIGDVLHYRLREGQSWRSRTSDVLGGTLMYRKAAWQTHPFSTNSSDEVREFVEGFDPTRVTDLEGAAAYIALAHAGVASPRQFDDGRWERRSIAELGSILGADADFYTRLRTAPRAPVTPSSPSSRVRVAAPFLVYDGYGSMAEYLVLGMLRSGAEVDVTPLRLDATATTDELQKAIRASGPVTDQPTVGMVWWGDDLRRFKASEFFVNTMWESSKLPADWPQRLAGVRAIVVPSRYVADVFRECGVTPPIEVVPMGVDGAVYHQMSRPPSEGVTTLMVGVFAPRKNIHLGVEAWSRAFDGDENARLLIKSRYENTGYVSSDPRITVVGTSEPTRGIAGWYEKADVFMALGNEGFGLPLVEAMATGLPVIALDSEGQADVCREARDLVLSVSPRAWHAVDEPPYGQCGVRAVPSVEDIESRLRWVATHREEARAIGRSASEWALANRSVWAMGPGVLQVMERHVVPQRPLRRQPTLCCPKPDGVVADYTQHLATARPWIRVVTAPGDLRSARVLHFQWSPGTWDDTVLTRLVQEARLSGLPVAITEHSVDATARAWEPLASALVVHTDVDASTVRARWPQLRVEAVEMGCPTWFPPRKKMRGRVVALVGRPSRSRGWWDALEAVRVTRGVSLLVLSRGGRDEAWEAWSRDSSGVLEDRIEAPTPREAAAAIAARADVVVLWHQAGRRQGPSYAARMALASGVPVITSPGPEFDDLEEVTYRPEVLADGVTRILEDDALQTTLRDAARAFCESRSWDRSAERHEQMWRSLECA
jgi:glycosyltransferase involved in cell wall biosynthesis